MQITIKGKVKAIEHKRHVNRFLAQMGLLIETKEESLMYLKLQHNKGKTDHTEMIKEKNIVVGDEIIAKAFIDCRKWQYTYIVNLVCTEINKDGP